MKARFKYQDFYRVVGAEITEIRKSQGLTVSQLANRSGQQFNTIRAIEEGDRFQFHHVIWLVSVLGISLDVFFRKVRSKTIRAANNQGEQHGEEVTKTEPSGIESFI